MKKYSVYLDTALRGADENGELKENPKAFRNISAVVPFVIEMAMTGSMPDSLVPIVGSPGCINVDPIMLQQVAKNINRVRFSLFSGRMGHLCLGANIMFMDNIGRSVLDLVAAADSDGIRYIHKTLQVPF